MNRRYKKLRGDTLVIFMVRRHALIQGYFFQAVSEFISFSQFLDFHSIYGTAAPKFTRIYGIMGTSFSGKMARPRPMIGRDTP